MAQKERDGLLKYTIGPEQLFGLPTIKKFLEMNKLEPIEFYEGTDKLDYEQ